MSLVLLAGYGAGEAQAQRAAPAAPGDKRVYTVNYPLAWMAERLAGGAANVSFPAPVDVDPAYWNPEVETVLEYQQADLVLLNGAGYAKWAARVSLPSARQVDTSRGYRGRFIEVDAGPVHSHGPGGEHSHGELAFTTWLDLELARQQAAAVALALAELLPDRAGEIQQRGKILDGVLREMDRQLSALGERLGGTPLLYSHPVYQYLQRRYGLNGRSLHWEPDQAPSERQWDELEALLRSHPAGIMLWEAAPLPEVAARLSELGIAVVVFAPLGNRPEAGDFESAMRANIEALDAVAP
jgi:zinc transport system substrate-binding protein